MRSTRISLAIDSGTFAVPAAGIIAVLRPRIGDDLSVLPQDRLVVLTGFKPDHDHFAARYSTKVDGTITAALVCLPRAKAAAHALIAQALEMVVQGGPILVDGQKTDGIESVLRDCKAAGLEPGPALSKAHGKAFVVAAKPAPDGWAATPRAIEGGFQTLPGVFSADAPDRGSMLLAAALPAKIGPKVADLGAGWGYLSRAVLEREGVKRLDLVEAEADALDCARANIQDDRVRFHWEDVTRFRPENLVETVVCNPPFHTGRDADPGVGLAFIKAARTMMAPDGVLWLVANRHLPYDAALAEAFLDVQDVGQDPAFRVIRAAKPRRKR
jgi:16S rRNA (guanine1207-N2)-methyltransferase